MEEVTARRSQGRWSAPTGGGGGKGSESRGRTRARLPGPRAPAREGRVQQQVCRLRRWAAPRDRGPEPGAQHLPPTKWLFKAEASVPSRPSAS